MTNITNITVEEIKDSRGKPTLSVFVWVGEKFGRFDVPSGASTGSNEAHEIRDDDGVGIQKAIKNIRDIVAPALIGQNVLNQSVIDGIMIKLDNTKNKENLGANAMIGVSIACAKVAAKVSKLEVYEYLRTLEKIKTSREIPLFFMNLINGGKHANNQLAFQEYHIIPNIKDAEESLKIGIDFQNLLEEKIKIGFGINSIIYGDEGGFSINTNNIKEPLFLLKKTINENKLENKISLALDVAASSFFNDKGYKIGEKYLSGKELMQLYDYLIDEFNLFSIEDPFDEKDFKNFRELKEKNTTFFGKKIFIVGDDLTVTNKDILEKAIKEKSINAMIIKPNQIGTLTETLETMKLARKNGIELIISHRSGETMDDFIADLAYAFGCFGLKAGAPSKPERIVKYNRIIDIVKNK